MQDISFINTLVRVASENTPPSHALGSPVSAGSIVPSGLAAEKPLSSAADKSGGKNASNSSLVPHELGTKSSGTAGSAFANGAADNISDSEALAVSLPKRKKGAMGPEEKKLARTAAAAKSKKITEAIREYVENVDEQVKRLANDLGVSEERIRQLAGQVSAIKNRKAASNWNILVYFKGKELNKGKISHKY